ncbi:MAG: leucine-rich repeat domain-containing protein, partial [Bacteroidaceae bacterium]|nr:leucine-rich repeat domain-containing protein [Bacteroidaceae bacterium]
MTSIDIPNSVTSIGTSVFNGCLALKKISVANDNTVYDSRENCNAIIETATNTLIVGCQSTIIPSSVTKIDEWALSGCTGLTSIDIPNTVTTIGEYAFYDCKGLTSVTIPGSVT